MKKWIHATTANADRITIDFYYDLDDSVDVSAAKKQHSSKPTASTRQVFKNTKRVMEEVKKHIESRGLKVLSCHPSKNEDSDSTYYDVDVKVETNTGKIEYVYFRVSNHFISSSTTLEQVENYYAGLTRKYKGLPKDADVSELFDPHSIVVKGKRFTNFDLAINKVKEEIDIYLKDKGII